MNKSVFVEELNNIGITVISFEFSQSGYVLELKLDPKRASGWEELECLPFTGLELAKTRSTGAYSRKVLFIPSNSKEFKDYSIKHMRYFGLGKEKALCDLKETVTRFGKRYTRYALIEYLKRIE